MKRIFAKVGNKDPVVEETYHLQIINIRSV